jgi:hypothetical protein
MEQLRSTFTSADAAAAAVSGRFLQLILHIVRDASPQLHGLVSDIRQLLFALPHSQLHEEVAGTCNPTAFWRILGGALLQPSRASTATVTIITTTTTTTTTTTPTGQYYEVVYELVLKHWNTTDSSKGQSVLVPSIQYARPSPAKSYSSSCLVSSASFLHVHVLLVAVVVGVVVVVVVVVVVDDLSLSPLMTSARLSPAGRFARPWVPSRVRAWT